MSNYNLRKKIVVTKSAQSTMIFGKKIAKWLIKQNPKDRAFVLSLRGDLGSGKTTFVQGLAKGLGIMDRVISPTFVIIKKLKVKSLKLKVAVRNSKLNKVCSRYFYHIDCYRLQKPEEILELGWQKIIAEPKNIVAIEWPEKIKKFLPRETICLDFKFVDKNQREIKIGKTTFFMVK